LSVAGYGNLSQIYGVILAIQDDAILSVICSA